MKTAKTLKSLVRMMLTWGFYETIHNRLLEWLEMFLKAILLQSGLQTGTPTQFGSEEHCPIQTQALKILIASSFNSSCPTSRNQDVQDFYTGWDNERGLRWRVDETEPPLWQHTNALMTAWKSRIQKDTVECMIKIPATQIEVIKQTLASFT